MNNIKNLNNNIKKEIYQKTINEIIEVLVKNNLTIREANDVLFKTQRRLEEQQITTFSS